jgi:uncharacterized membrane protein
MSSVYENAVIPDAAKSLACSRSGCDTNVGNTERLLSTLAGGWILISGLRRGSAGGLCEGMIGGSLLYRGLMGHCHMYQMLGINTSNGEHQAGLRQKEGYRINKRIVVNRSPEELYGFWRNLENLPRVFDHLVSVQPHNATHSHWVAKGPLNTRVEWDAEIIEEREGELIAWRSIAGAEVSTAGSVHFRKVPRNMGTEVSIALRYSPPAGSLGHAVAQLFGQTPEDQIEQELDQFRQMMESYSEQTGSRMNMGYSVSSQASSSQPSSSQPSSSQPSSSQPSSSQPSSSQPSSSQPSSSQYPS